MAVISLKCPNCGGELLFDPSAQRYKCPYCLSDFTQRQVEELQQKQPSQENGTADFSREERTAERTADGTAGRMAAVYHCPSCGAEILTDATTAASFCYYCHNPVIFSGQVSGEYLPKRIIPFAVDRARAETIFLENVSKKKFIPRGFFEKKQIEKLTGVYFPFWQVDWKGRGTMNARGTRVRVWRMGDTEYQETKVYDISREGSLSFSGITKNALKKANRMLVEGVQPFDQSGEKPFSVGYLSGFQAERRDMEPEEFRQELDQETREYARHILNRSIQGYTTVTPRQIDVRKDAETWNYVMVPVWVLTYRGRNDTLYYYTINGQNGKVCGRLPIDYGKLGLWSGLIAAAVFVLGMVGGLLI